MALVPFEQVPDWFWPKPPSLYILVILSTLSAWSHVWEETPKWCRSLLSFRPAYRRSAGPAEVICCWGRVQWGSERIAASAQGYMNICWNIQFSEYSFYPWERFEEKHRNTAGLSASFSSHEDKIHRFSVMTNGGLTTFAKWCFGGSKLHPSEHPTLALNKKRDYRRVVTNGNNPTKKVPISFWPRLPYDAVKSQQNTQCHLHGHMLLGSVKAGIAARPRVSLEKWNWVRSTGPS